MEIFAIVGCSCVWTLYTPSQSPHSEFELRSLFHMGLNQQLIAWDLCPSNVNHDRLGPRVLMRCEGSAMREQSLLGHATASANSMHIAKASHNG